MPAVPASDERRHQPAGPGPWQESWWFDYWSDDGSWGGYVQLAVGDAGPAWFWAAVAGAGRPLVAVRDHEVAPPAGHALEVRSPGLWAELVCEEPLAHWSAGLEAFAVAYDEPVEAWRSERGDPVPLGFDLGWEAEEPPATVPGGGGQAGYGHGCRVHGEVLVGSERLRLDGWGWRRHEWGPRDWWAGAWSRGGGRLDDGTFVPTEVVSARTAADGLPEELSVRGGGLELPATAVASAPVLLPGPGGRSRRLSLALCRYRSRDGRTGHGWTGFTD